VVFAAPGRVMLPRRFVAKMRRVGKSYCVIIFGRLYVAALLPQQGHRGKAFMIALIKRRRMVAIEFGM
jgi:hypothetical protein